jgi:protein gp37
MGETTGISWCHHTCNGWSGCAIKSEACRHCYAMNLPPKMRRGAEWGPKERRILAPDAYLREAFRWNASAAEANEIRRVFLGSVMDIGEGHPDVVDQRWKVLAIAWMTPHLDWLLLTKRPDELRIILTTPTAIERVQAAVDAWWMQFRSTPLGARAAKYLRAEGDRVRPFGSWPNLVVGATVENQERYRERILELLAIPAARHFLSIEPMVGPIRFTTGGAVWLNMRHPDSDGRVDWVIAGGESGHEKDVRPTPEEWFRSLRDQCAAANVPFHFKQWGEWAPLNDHDDPAQGAPKDAPGREIVVDDYRYRRVGKRLSGRYLDGLEHLAFYESVADRA